MKRGGPLKRSDKSMAAGGLRSANKAETDLWKVLLEQVGCAVCRFVLRIEDTPAEIHHLIDGQRRISHMHVLPLCPVHHRQGIEAHPSRHSVNGLHGGLDIFERTYETEMELVIKCEDWINYPYVTGLLNDEHALRSESEAQSGDCDSADTDAQRKPDYSDVQEESIRVCEVQKIGWPVHISITHHLRREPDMDNLNAKGAIDGLVNSGLLEDDTRKYVKGISHYFEKSIKPDPEKTVITLTEVM